ncbi:MAG: HD domain-containing protein [Treponema sp.]|jgi:putative two-component system response regulator|nr:HD domain-containing protein [Treponema sp.]
MVDRVNDVKELEPLETKGELEKKEHISRIFLPSHSIFFNGIFPMFLVDKNLKITGVNSPSQNLFNGFSLTGRYFIDIFGKAFAMEDLREIRNTLIRGINGYCWKGKAWIKSRETLTVQTKVYIFPGNMKVRSPRKFVVMFDNVTEENKEVLRSIFVSLLKASKLKDNDTGKHVIRVNFYSRRLTAELYQKHSQKYRQIDADFLDNIGFLASMHDVGKIGTPDDILNKKGPLSEWEWTIMREHTKNGAFILSTYPNPMAKEIALCHHEHWDGTGYPFRLEGEMIPLAARIVAIADVYDALRMWRCYKPALSHKAAVEKMSVGKNTHFDPFLIDIFCTISDDFKRIYEQNRD